MCLRAGTRCALSVCRPNLRCRMLKQGPATCALAATFVRLQVEAKSTVSRVCGRAQGADSVMVSIAYTTGSRHALNMPQRLRAQQCAHPSFRCTAPKHTVLHSRMQAEVLRLCATTAPLHAQPCVQIAGLQLTLELHVTWQVTLQTHCGNGRPAASAFVHYGGAVCALWQRLWHAARLERTL